MNFSGSIASIMAKKSWSDLGKLLKEMQGQIESLRTAQPYAMASRDFDGTMDPPTAGTTGWALTQSGTPVFNDLVLRGQIIGNDALNSPVSPAVAHAQASNFALSTTAVQKVDLSVAVPTGFSRAIALATISATAVNTTAAQDAFLGYADVDFVGSPGGYLAAADGAPGYAVGIAHTETALATSLSGSLHFRGMLQSLGAAWTANAFNTVNLDALVLFLR